MLCAGTLYGFGSYSEDIVDILMDKNATACSTRSSCESFVEVVGSFGNVGMWTNILGGLLFDKCGFKVSVTAGAMLTGIGYLGMYTALSTSMLNSGVSSYILCSFWLSAGHGSGYYFLSSMWSGVRAFESPHHSFVIGALSATFAMSSSFFVTVLEGCVGGRREGGKCTDGILAGDVVDYTIMCAITLAIVGVASALTYAPKIRPKIFVDSRRLGYVALAILCLVLVLASTSILNELIPKIEAWTPILFCPSCVASSPYWYTLNTQQNRPR